MLTFPAERLRAICEETFIRAGASRENARGVAEHLVLANLLGHDSHGVGRVASYLGAIRRGELRPAATPRVARDDGNVAVVDGDWTFGQVAANAATRLAIARAKAHRLALVGAVRAHHVGRMGHYAELAAAEGVITILGTGGFGEDARCAVPFGGAEKAFGGNPLAIGFPAASAAPMVLDFATCAIAIGKIEQARDKGQRLPPGAIVDRQGRPSVDPGDYFAGGAALPFGGHKGSALALTVELLATALLGTAEFRQPGDSPRGFAPCGTFILAVDSGALRAADAAAADAESTIERVKGVRPAPGCERVMVPGQPEQATCAQRLAHGIPVPENTWESVRQAAAEWGIDLPTG